MVGGRSVRVAGGLVGLLLPLLPPSGGAGAAAAPAADALPAQRVLPLALAQEAATAAVAACAADGFQVSVAVVDHAGVLRALARADFAAPHTVDSSWKKAYTALTLRRSTADYAKLVADNPANAGLRDMNERILLLAGGLPIAAGGQVLAGIGVGGAPGGDKDEACARKGIEAIRERLG